MKRRLVLLVLDGWGISASREFNAIALARTPHFSELSDRFAMTELVASGARVGLPEGQMGNSEVGHTNMGAGRVVYQELTRIDHAIREGEFFANPALAASIDRCADGRRALHVLGLVSDGGVHSHIKHLLALLDMAKKRGAQQVFVHVFTDGRDTSPNSGIEFVGELQQVMARLGVGRIASLSGRYWAMDRDNRWERTRRAIEAMVSNGDRSGREPLKLIADSYAAGVMDEFIEPVVITDADDKPVGRITDDDSVLCFNFRADRVRQITLALTGRSVQDLPRPSAVHYTCFTEYDARFALPVAFPPEELSEHLGEVLSTAGRTNLRLAETEKYAHVTYFFNCGHEQPYPGEDRLLLPSPKVATYDLQPEMSAPAITDALLDDLRRDAHDVVICNFANADMVGHTGNLAATISAVETVDRCLGRISRAILDADGILIVTADHGNCEQMWDADRGMPHTAHTANPVPFILIRDGQSAPLRDSGALCDVAPTILQLLELRQPIPMTGRSLLDL